MITAKQYAAMVVRANNNFLKDALRTKVAPPILGEVTPEILAAHGVKIAGRYSPLKSEWWVEQHGNRVSEIFTLYCVE